MLSAVLHLAALQGLGAFAMVESVRRLPYIRDWVSQGRKPWACDPCASFWSPLLVAPAFVAGTGEWKECLLATLPASGLCLALLTWRASKVPAGPPLFGGES